MPPLRPHPTQYKLWTTNKRFVVVPCGRRSGKTELAKRFTILNALRGSTFTNARYFLAAPTRSQAKDIYWADLKKYSPLPLVSDKSETELFIEYVNGSRIYVRGMDKPERIEGTPWDGGVLDEYANMKSRAWLENVRPALADRRGWCWLIGVPEGRNHYYDTYKDALVDSTGEWGVYSWISADILHPDEIAQIKLKYDPLTYQQEYEGSFVNFAGSAYYNFSDKTHYTKIDYDPSKPLNLCFDFNISPGVAVALQEVPQQEVHNTVIPDATPTVTVAVGEVHIPRNSNTEIVCNRLLNDYSNHNSLIYIYGDATGGAGGTTKLSGSDWDIVQRTLNAGFGKRVQMRVSRSNPRERIRVNCVNSRLKSVSGFKGLMINAHKCPHLVKDLEGVQTVEGGSGEIDKKKTPELTHLSDALGYYIYRQHPINKTTIRQPLRGF
jgi:hypothetical protein